MAVTLPTRPVTLQSIFDARRRVAGRLRRTPLVHSMRLSRATGGDVHLKLESLQTTHSFKLRGALNALLVLRATQKGAGPLRVVTASAGNHGRALAYAAEQLGIRATIFAPHDAPRTKREAIVAHGADLRTCGSWEETETSAKALAAAGGGLFVSAYSDPEVIAGAGTVAIEIVEDLPDVDLLIVPVGGGGLISGVATAASAIAPAAEVVGVEAAASPAFHTSLARGRVTQVTVGPSIADGLVGNMDPDTITFDMVRRLVTRVVLAGEEALLDGIRMLASDEHVIAEGAGAAAVAAVLAGQIDVRGRRAAVVVSGANIDAPRLGQILRSSP